MSTTASTASSRSPDYWLTAGLFLFTAIVFWPAARWLASETFAREQLKQSFFIVVIAGAWIAWDRRESLRLNVQLNTVSLVWLTVSYALAGAAVLLKNPLLFLGGLVAAVGGLVNCVFGYKAFRRAFPLLVVFAVLILCVLIFPILDWPLRKMAGVEAARMLKAVGLAPKLVVATQPDVKLYLMTGPSTFLVATECNGFGLITSGMLLALIRLLYRRASWLSYGLILPFCVALGFVFNFLRITAIVLLAPKFPAHYTALHETAGLIALYAGLAIVWWVTRGRPPVREERVGASVDSPPS